MTLFPLVPQTRSMQHVKGAVAKTQIWHQYHFKETTTMLKRSLAIFLQSPILVLKRSVDSKYITKKNVILGGLEIVKYFILTSERFFKSTYICLLLYLQCIFTSCMMHTCDNRWLYI